MCTSSVRAPARSPPGVTVRRVRIVRGGRLVRLLSFAVAAPRAVARETWDVVVGFGRTPRQDVVRVGGGTHRSYLARMEAAGLRGRTRGPVSPRDPLDRGAAVRAPRSPPRPRRVAAGGERGRVGLPRAGGPAHGGLQRGRRRALQSRAAPGARPGAARGARHRPGRAAVRGGRVRLPAQGLRHPARALETLPASAPRAWFWSATTSDCRPGGDRLPSRRWRGASW